MANDLVAHLYEYRTLIGCRDELHEALSGAERERLDALERLFHWRAPDGTDVLPSLVRRRMARCDVDITASILVGARRSAAVIVNLGGDGLALDPAPRLAAGVHAVVVVEDEGDGREYRFPIEIRWCRSYRQHAALGARFRGVPVEIRRQRVALMCDTTPYLARLRPRKAS
jgi:hypothetical protein